jgi:uncharacterized protein (TIRG00374 family)
MKKQLISILQYIIFFGGGITLAWWQFHSMTPEQLAQFNFALASANYWIIFPVIIMALAAHLSRSLRWQLLIEPLGYKTSIYNVFGVTMVGYLVNTFVPRLGEIVKCTMLGKYEKIPAEKLIGTILIERVFDVICYAGFIVFTILIQYKLISGFIKNDMAAMSGPDTPMPLWVKAIIFIAIVFVLFAIWKFKAHPQSKFTTVIKNFGKGLGEGFAAIKNLKKKRAFLLHTVFIWSMYILQIYVAFFSIKEIAHLDLAAACAVLTLATLALIIMPGGIGTFPKAIFYVLLLYKIPGAIGEAFGWLMWGATTFIILLFGSICLLLLLYKHRKEKLPDEELISESTIDTVI